MEVCVLGAGRLLLMHKGEEYSPGMQEADVN